MEMNGRDAARMLIAMVAVTGLAACQQERDNAGPSSTVRDVPAAAVAAQTSAQPAQVPANDPSLPPYGTPPSPATNIDATATALTKGERDKAMPLEGQVNNYSSDASAKRGDEAIPRGTSAGPRGDETVSTPNSYPKESK